MVAFGKELLTPLIVCFLCITCIYICNFVVSYFDFESGISVLIAPLPGRCLHFTLENVSSAKYLVVLG